MLELPISPNVKLESEMAAVQEAYRKAAEGNFELAEMLLRALIDVRPDFGPAWQLLAMVLWNAGMPTLACRAYEQAARIEPGPAMQQALDSARQQMAALPPSTLAAPYLPPVSPARVLVIKSWGHGFWSDVDQLIGHLLVADLTGRTPVIHWGSNSYFGDHTPRSCFADYFVPLNDLTIADFAGGDAAEVWPPKWSPATLAIENVAKWDGPHSCIGVTSLMGRIERVVVADYYAGVASVRNYIPAGHPLHGKSVNDIYAHYFANVLRVQPALRDAAEQFIRESIAAPYVAVHVRGTDKIIEVPSLEAMNREYFARIDEQLARRPAAKLFLMTDSLDYLGQFQSRYGDRLAFTQCTRSFANIGVHRQDRPDGRQIGREIVLDSLVAAGAEHFIGNGTSNVSVMISYLGAFADDRISWIEPNMLHRYNAFLFRPGWAITHQTR